ncbi:elongation factor G [Glycomyces buryatensis]|uniref:TetM/TetW/TetO/TetS family tetracycline resistance ribosomal protection protein n=1 Tax=Glycomyces buryatensis TaxID=2570927 RepID=A0A4S8PTG5_9ACTN|nr:TetM/TetW/TetO/TetS family tetracycline resistance ribosomal protection protein [Glycomyces buryatensis]THV33621.1 TetM/TetW/TetO/TetS family tetracycline resistance ribosomal protection protein [Glycomyces buryatensis]
MRTLNLGILAHVDAGKTSLTERLLHEAGVTDALGSVDSGSTQTDSLDLERRRGITIKAAVVSFTIGDTVVNLIDTPGHPDFIAEVERAMNVLDGAVLVVSAVEGVQAQTRILMRALRRLGIPTLIFVNKIDRAGARYEDLLADLAAKLDPAVIAMDTVEHIKGIGARSQSSPRTDQAFLTELTDLLAEHDDAFLADYVGDERAASPARIRRSLVEQTAAARVFPVYFGSAITGEGVDGLTEGIRHLLPAADGEPAGPVSATVFKVERGSAGEKIAYARMYSGTISVRDRLPVSAGEGKVTGISVFDQGDDHRAQSVSAGRIAKLWGLDARIGDSIGLAPKRRTEHFAPPTLETVVVPARETDRVALHQALAQLAEQDPLIGLHHNESESELSLSLYGEVQKEVIEATLADEFGLDVDFQESTVICIERPTGSGEAVQFIAVEPNPFLATVGLRIDPAPIGHASNDLASNDAGIEFKLGVELGSMPPAFFNAVEESVHRTFNEGLRGWQVHDCTVTMTHSGYWARQSSAHGSFDKSMSSTAGDFRNLTRVVLMDALARAGTAVHEPVHRFRIEVPEDALRGVLALLAKLRAVPGGPPEPVPQGKGRAYVLEGSIPAASVHALGQRLPSLTSGEGVAECVFDRYEPVSGPAPSRTRTRSDPLCPNVE